MIGYKLFSVFSRPTSRAFNTIAPAQNGKLAGKVAMLTGSTDGIGLAMARRLGEDGASVVVSSRKQENVDRAVAELQGEGISVHGVVCHVANPEHRVNLVKETVEAFGGIDIFVSNAGVNPLTYGLMNCSENVWEKVLDVNLKSPFLLTQLVVPHMRKRKGGSIVYTSSNSAYITPSTLGSYGVSKTGLLSLMKVFAEELVGDNIRVNCVAPGATRTKFVDNIMADKELLEILMARTPMKRLAEPHEIGGAVSFLCSDDSSYMTGETIVMAGGWHSRL